MLLVLYLHRKEQQHQPAPRWKIRHHRPQGNYGRGAGQYARTEQGVPLWNTLAGGAFPRGLAAGRARKIGFGCFAPNPRLVATCRRPVLDSPTLAKGALEVQTDEPFPRAIPPDRDGGEGKPEKAYPPLQGDASLILAMRRHAEAEGWTEAQLLRKAEAIRRRLKAIRAMGTDIRNPAGLALTLMKTMEAEEVDEWLTKPAAASKSPWWEKGAASADAKRRARDRARDRARKLRGERASDDNPETAARRRKISRGSFDAASNVAARRRILGDENSALPEGIKRRVHSAEAPTDDK